MGLNLPKNPAFFKESREGLKIFGGFFYPGLGFRQKNL